MSDQTTVVDGRPRNPRVMALVALVAVLALVALWFLVLSPLLAGDEDAELTVPTPVVPEATDGSPAAPEQETGSAETADGAVPVETYEVFLSRDPFKPIRAAAGGSGGTTSGGTTTGGAPAGGTTGDGSVAPAPDQSGDSGTVAGRSVTLVDVLVEDGQERAVVEVDGATHEVAEGDEFAGSFRVLSIDPPCATFLYGDSAFTLCEGERILK